MKHQILVVAALLLISCDRPAATEPEAAAPPKPSELDRRVLPLIEPEPPVYTELDVRDAVPPPRFEVKAPGGAPNVVVVLVDDLGFAGTSTFGGPIGTPTFDQLANAGLHYNNFHTTAVCSPTRAALKSGRFRVPSFATERCDTAS
ncbi:MAG: hypothetical protein AMJ63_03535 [Myxococcales bacterium SG8_38_1]|nr:MAG: hypothetical protein AMJ63_03535 [Myxococcales bacterium SG8_38_1]